MGFGGFGILQQMYFNFNLFFVYILNIIIILLRRKLHWFKTEHVFQNNCVMTLIAY